MYAVYSQQKNQTDTISDNISAPDVTTYLLHLDGDTMLAEDGESSAEAIQSEPLSPTFRKDCVYELC